MESQPKFWRAELMQGPYLLQQTHHAGVLAHGQAQRHGQGLLVLQAAGVKLGPELDLQLPVFLLGELELRHAALQLRGRHGGGQGERLQIDLPWRREKVQRVTSVSTATVTSFFRLSQDRSEIRSAPRR